MPPRRHLPLLEQLSLFEKEDIEIPGPPTSAWTLAMYLTIPAAWRPALVVADGMGVDSTALLIELHRQNIRPDAVVHADTGDEKRATVAYREERRRWLAAVGFPDLVIVRRPPSVQGNRKRADGRTGVTYATLGENCIENHTLPSIAFGKKGCSSKWKIEPQEAWARAWAPAQRTWAHGQKVFKLIGYDAGPKDSRRAHDLTDDREYRYGYPLREWGWERERCIGEIQRAGVPLPPKSACTFCTASQTWEVAELVVDDPEGADYVVHIEDTARPYLRGSEGLWRSTIKGMRGAVARPGSMADFIRALRADRNLLDYHLSLKPDLPQIECGCPA